MALTLGDVGRLASLTRLNLDQQEQENLRGQLEAILGYVDRLAAVDTQGVPETEGGGEVSGPPAGGGNRESSGAMRGDEVVVQDELGRSLILQNFPDSVAGALKVPAVFEKPKG